MLTFFICVIAGTKSQYYGRVRKHPNTFIVKHFAGEVTYTADNFMDKNKDTLAPALLNYCNSSSMSLLSEPVPVIDMTSGGSDTAAATPDPSATPGKGGKSSSKLTLCAKFKNDLDVLITTLRKTTPHFVRCVKPNDLQTADKFDSVLALNQLKYSGLFEAINIRKAGYSCRIPHDTFINTFSVCVPPTKGGTKRDWSKKQPFVRSGASTDSSKKKKPPALCYNLLEFLASEINCIHQDSKFQG